MNEVLTAGEAAARLRALACGMRQMAAAAANAEASMVLFSEAFKCADAAVSLDEVASFLEAADG